MKKFYEEPEIQIHNYSLPARDVVMTSDPNSGEDNNNNLGDGDDVTYPYFD